MKLLSVILQLQALASLCVAAKCKRNGCYNAVVLQDTTPLDVRQADCRAVLQVANPKPRKTVYVTHYVTRIPKTTKIIDVTATASDAITTTTTTTTTIADNWGAFDSTAVDETGGLGGVETYYENPTAVIKRDMIPPMITGFPAPAAEEVTAEDVTQETHLNLLDARDTYLVAGRKPGYASSCRNLARYASACVCLGVKPNRFAPKTKTRKVVVNKPTQTITSYVTQTTVTPTVTVTSTVTQDDSICSLPHQIRNPGRGDKCICASPYIRDTSVTGSLSCISPQPPRPRDLVDGGFESTGTSAWTIGFADPGVTVDFKNTASPHGGRQAAMITLPTNAGVNFHQILTVTPGKVFALKMWLRQARGPYGYGCYSYVDLVDGTTDQYIQNLSGGVPPPAAWGYAPLGSWTGDGRSAVKVIFTFKCFGGASNVIFVDDISL